MTAADGEALEAFRSLCDAARVEGRSAVDEWIAERRADAAREEAAFARDERRAAGVVEVPLEDPAVLPIPTEFQNALHWQAGDVLFAECDGESLFIRRAEPDER